MAQAPNLAFLSGSTRDGSTNVKLARLAQKIAEGNGVPATYLDLSDYPMPIYDGDLETADGIPETAWNLKRDLDRHHGVFIASPEYNAGMSPLLKNAIDWLTRIKDGDEAPGTVFRTRAWAIGSAAASEVGGIRGLIQLRQTLAVGLGAVVIGGQIQVPSSSTAFDEDGSLTDEARQKFLKAYVENLAHVAGRLYVTA